MYLVYAKLSEPRTYSHEIHVFCDTREQARDVVVMTRQHGLTATSRMSSYVVFESPANVVAAALVSAWVYSFDEFKHRWENITAAPPEPKHQYEFMTLDMNEYPYDEWDTEMERWGQRGYELISVIRSERKVIAFFQKRSE